MPQMAPMNWLMLMIYFSIIFMILNSMNFYFFMYNPKKTKLSHYMKTMNWKW